MVRDFIIRNLSINIKTHIAGGRLGNVSELTNAKLSMARMSGMLKRSMPNN